jgi:hypothetical protein
VTCSVGLHPDTGAVGFLRQGADPVGVTITRHTDDGDDLWEQGEEITLVIDLALFTWPNFIPPLSAATPAAVWAQIAATRRLPLVIANHTAIDYAQLSLALPQTPAPIDPPSFDTVPGAPGWVDEGRAVRELIQPGPVPGSGLQQVLRLREILAPGTTSVLTATRRLRLRLGDLTATHAPPILLTPGLALEGPDVLISAPDVSLRLDSQSAALWASLQIQSAENEAPLTRSASFDLIAYHRPSAGGPDQLQGGQRFTTQPDPVPADARWHLWVGAGAPPANWRDPALLPSAAQGWRATSLPLTLPHSSELPGLSTVALRLAVAVRAWPEIDLGISLPGQVRAWLNGQPLSIPATPSPLDGRYHIPLPQPLLHPWNAPPGTVNLVTIECRLEAVAGPGIATLGAQARTPLEARAGLTGRLRSGYVIGPGNGTAGGGDDPGGGAAPPPWLTLASEGSDASASNSSESPEPVTVISGTGVGSLTGRRPALLTARRLTSAPPPENAACLHLHPPQALDLGDGATAYRTGFTLADCAPGLYELTLRLPAAPGQNPSRTLRYLLQQLAQPVKAGDATTALESGRLFDHAPQWINSPNGTPIFDPLLIEMAPAWPGMSSTEDPAEFTSPSIWRGSARDYPAGWPFTDGWFSLRLIGTDGMIPPGPLPLPGRLIHLVSSGLHLTRSHPEGPFTLTWFGPTNLTPHTSTDLILWQPVAPETLLLFLTPDPDRLTGMLPPIEPRAELRKLFWSLRPLEP